MYLQPHVKLCISIKTVRDIIPSIRRAFRVAQEGVPGPVFIETPIEILWPESLFMEMIGAGAGASKGAAGKDAKVCGACEFAKGVSEWM